MYTRILLQSEIPMQCKISTEGKFMPAELQIKYREKKGQLKMHASLTNKNPDEDNYDEKR